MTAQVLSFPLSDYNWPYLADYVGSRENRLDTIVAKLGSLADLLYLLKQSEALEGTAAGALSTVEDIVRDCIAVAELRPEEKSA